MTGSDVGSDGDSEDSEDPYNFVLTDDDFRNDSDERLRGSSPIYPRHPRSDDGEEDHPEEGKIFWEKERLRNCVLELQNEIYPADAFDDHVGILDFTRRFLPNFVGGKLVVKHEDNFLLHVISSRFCHEEDIYWATRHLKWALMQHFWHSVSGFDKLRHRFFTVSIDNHQAKHSSLEKRVEHLFVSSHIRLNNITINLRHYSLLLDVLALWTGKENRFRRAPFLKNPFLYPWKHAVEGDFYTEWKDLFSHKTYPEWMLTHYNQSKDAKFYYFACRYNRCSQLTGNWFGVESEDGYRMLNGGSFSSGSSFPIEISIQTERWFYSARRKIAVRRIALFYASRENLRRNRDGLSGKLVTIPWN